MNHFMQHLKKNIFSGLLAVVPLFLVFIVLRFLYVAIDQNVLNLIDDLIGIRVPGLGLIFITLLLYGIGLFSRNLFGKWFFNFFERIMKKIPIIGTTYQVGKQISTTLSLPEKQVFKKAVLVNYLTKNIYTIGFITGSLKDKNSGEKLYKVFVPTPPNPTSGTMVILKESEIIDPEWSVDEGIRTVISGGIIGPEDITFNPCC